MQAFHADVKKGWSLLVGEWFTLKCFKGGWCFFRGMTYPPSTRVLHIPCSHVQFKWAYSARDFCIVIEFLMSSPRFSIMTSKI